MRRLPFPWPIHPLPLTVAILAPVAVFLLLLRLTVPADPPEPTREVLVLASVVDELPPLEEPEKPPAERMDESLQDELEGDEESLLREMDLPPLAAAALPEPMFRPEPDVVMAMPSPVTMKAMAGAVRVRGLDNGEGGDFGQRVETRFGGHYLDGALIGVLIDFKRNADGSPRADYTDEGYWKDVAALVAADFGDAARKRFYDPQKEMAFTHLLMRRQPAENGPKSFGVGERMSSRGWAAYYRGTIVPKESARYRFVGYFDDQLVVRLDRKVVLEANWGGGRKPRPRRITGWAPSDAAACGKWAGFHGIVSPLVPGDWFAVEAGKPVFIEIMIGERTGSKVGGLLLIQQEGVEYRRDHVGRPVFPIFATRPLSLREREYIASLKYQIGIDSPLFNAGGVQRALKEITADDVAVEVDMPD